MLCDVALNELQQLVSHVLSLGSGNRLEVVVELDGNIQVHSLHFLDFLDLPHPLSAVRISDYEYGTLAAGTASWRPDPRTSDSLGHFVASKVSDFCLRFPPSQFENLTRDAWPCARGILAMLPFS